MASAGSGDRRGPEDLKAVGLDKAGHPSQCPWNAEFLSQLWESVLQALQVILTSTKPREPCHSC